MPAPRWRRLAAGVIDATIAFAISIGLSSTVGLFFARRAVVTLRIGDAETIWQGPLPMILGVFGEIVYLMPFILWFAWALDPLTGRTLGKRTLGLEVRLADGAPAPRRARWFRHVVEASGFWILTLSLLTGSSYLAFLGVMAGTLVALGCLSALGSDARTLHDKLTGTVACQRR